MTLEQRVEKLERSCRRWRVGCIAAAMLAVGACAAGNKPAESGKGDLSHLTLTALTVQNPSGGPALNISADGLRTTLQISDSASPTGIMMTVDNKSANLVLTHGQDRTQASAGLSADDTSGTIALRGTAGKIKVLEP